MRRHVKLPPPFKALGDGGDLLGLLLHRRESFAFAAVSCAVALRIEDGQVQDARIALGGVATKPWRATAAERSLLGEGLTPETAQRAGVLAFADAKPRKANRFKMSLGPKTVAQALMIAQERSGA